jgi:hypothetical protein
MDRETLVANLENASVPCKEEHDKLIANITKILNDILVSNNLTKVAKISRVNDSSAEVEVFRPNNKWGHTFSIYFHDRFNGDGSKTPRKVELNVGTFGSFGAEDAPEMNFYIVAGIFATNLPMLQKKVDEVGFDSYEDARRKMYSAKWELEKFDNAVRDTERAKQKVEIASKIVIGAKVVVRKKSQWRDEITKTIEHITGKNVLFKEDYGKRTKKDEFIANILSNKWEFAA